MEHEHGHGHGHHGHGHGHGHEHGMSSVDEVTESSSDGRRVLYLSLVIMLVTAALQGLVVILSGSVALLGDTLHNVADALTAVPLLIAFRLALRPATHRFTYGFGRAEDLAGIFVVAMIALSSVLAAFEAVRRLLHPQDVHHLWAVALAALIGCAGNEWVAFYRIRVGRRIGSAALVADGLHARTDGLTSLAVLLGVAGSALGWRLADPIVGLVITVAILGILRSAVTQVGERLMDAVDPQLVTTVEGAVRHVPGVEVDHVRARWIGHVLRAEVDVTVAPHLTIAEGDSLAARVSAEVTEHLPQLRDIAVRVRPAT